MIAIRLLEERKFNVLEVENGEQAKEKLIELIPKWSSIWFGGSMTIENIGILDILRSEDYHLYDRKKFPKWSPEAQEMQRKWQHADFFISSCNAITESWQLFFGETNGNRISSIIYGPKKVILVIGKNKIVKNEEMSFERIEYVAWKVAEKVGKPIKEILCNKVIIERQWDPERMLLILVNQELWT